MEPPKRFDLEHEAALKQKMEEDSLRRRLLATMRKLARHEAKQEEPEFYPKKFLSRAIALFLCGFAGAILGILVMVVPIQTGNARIWIPMMVLAGIFAGMVTLYVTWMLRFEFEKPPDTAVEKS